MNPPKPDDPNFGTTLGTYLMIYDFVGNGWAIQHTRDIAIEITRKLDKIEDMLAYLLLAGYEDATHTTEE